MYRLYNDARLTHLSSKHEESPPAHIDCKKRGSPCDPKATPRRMLLRRGIDLQINRGGGKIAQGWIQRTAVAANFFTIASSNLRSLSFKLEE